jgi:hypothetical protein
MIGSARRGSGVRDAPLGPTRKVPPDSFATKPVVVRNGRPVPSLHEDRAELDLSLMFCSNWTTVERAYLNRAAKQLTPIALEKTLSGRHEGHEL